MKLCKCGAIIHVESGICGYCGRTQYKLEKQEDVHIQK